jgi:hypothetical protein
MDGMRRGFLIDFGLANYTCLKEMSEGVEWFYV